MTDFFLTDTFGHIIYFLTIFFHNFLKENLLSQFTVDICIDIRLEVVNKMLNRIWRFIALLLYKKGRCVSDVAG